MALCAIALIFLASCAKPVQPTELLSEPTPQSNRLTGQIAEVSPPETLETLKQIIDAYTPQVRILSPRPGEVLDDTSVSVRLQVRGLPLFKDDAYDLGPHLHLFLDNEPYQAVYDLSEPITFDGLSPGTHTLRVFASRPWHESFKNQGAFDQRTFHVVAPTPQNELNAKAPLLTYSRPQATYGAEPIMLDFYLTNAPLHMSAQAEANDDLHDWRIRCTVNDQSFVFDQWQPIWLKGFKPGRNWVQLELIDESGNPIDNRFNNTVRIIDYQPGGSDTLSRLVRGELGLKDVAGIIDPTYVPPTPEPTAETPEPQPPAADVETPEQNAPEPEITQPDITAPEPSQPETTQEQPESESTAPDAQGISPDEPEDETPPTPSLLPEKSIESEAAKDDQFMPEDNGAGEDAEADALNPDRSAVEASPAIAPESKDAIEDMVPLADPEIPPVLSPQVEPEPVPVRPAPAIPEATPEPGTKGLLNRFKQWRNPANPAPAPASPVPTPKDTFGDLPQVAPDPDLDLLPNPESGEAPEPHRVQPEMVEPDSDSSGEEQAEPSPPITEKAPEADSSEAKADEPREPKVAPRSPLAPEARPFI
ncbi:hypothetical protein NIES30_16640 [Phormidium tenue NIES-30]|uniref:FHA domain-containing protein n=1 Tax=Phormidium tenue NIES-30 TaxID=549789 RepID=A0A1U7J2G6_9CYAN|nr:hypothetical protein NIES30_16640 [Phormidium tenue NIES-30]